MTDQVDNSKVDSVIRKCQSLIQAKRFDEAASQLKTLLSEEPENIEVIYTLAVCQRRQKEYTPSLANLELIIAKVPEHARAYQEAGYIHQALQQSSKAVVALEKAVELNPALFGSWRALANESGYAQQSEAKRHAQWLSSLPPELVSVISFIHQNKLHRAERICRHFLKNNQRHPEGMRLLAELGSKFQILDDAEFLLASCLEFEPKYQRARLDYVTVLHKRQKYHLALEQAQILLDSDPTNANFLISLGNAQQATGDFSAAVKTFEKVLLKNPGNHAIHLTLGHALKTMGRVDEAIQAYQKSYQVKTDFGDAFWSLANLKTYQFSSDERKQMRDCEAANTTSVDDRIHLCFALGKDFENSDDFAEAFTYYQRGNKLKNEQEKYDRQRIDAALDVQQNICDAAFFKRHQQTGCTAPDPIFIVGLPRAGSTLLEQILASHSQVDGTMELSNILSLAHRLNGRQVIQETPRYPGILESISAEDLTKAGELYMDETKHHRQSAAFFIDKMPNNFRHIALIQLILPNAKIIDARRYPMSCCFSGFKQLFGEGQQFSYDLDEIGHYYRRYVQIMDHWGKELPGKILRVQYEDVIADLETQVHRILDYCGLPFEQACVDFHENKRAVRTPSSEQVRQPIYKSGLEQWRNFEPYLDPLKASLGSNLL